MNENENHKVVRFNGKLWEFDQHVTLDVYRSGDEKIYVDKEHKVAYRGIKIGKHESVTEQQ